MVIILNGHCFRLRQQLSVYMVGHFTSWKKHLCDQQEVLAGCGLTIYQRKRSTREGEEPGLINQQINPQMEKLAQIIHDHRWKGNKLYCPSICFNDKRH